MVYKFITPVKIEGLEMLYEIGFTTIMRKKTWYMMASEIANLDKVVAVTPQSNKAFKWRFPKMGIASGNLIVCY